MSQAVSGATNAVHRGSYKAREKLSRVKTKIKNIAETVTDQDKRLWLRKKVRMLVRPEDKTCNVHRLTPINSMRSSTSTLDPPAPNTMAEDGGILDAEFDRCQDLLDQDQPGPDWELLSDMETGRVWRKQDANSNSCVYRTYAKMTEPLPLLVNALTDLEKRKDWDQYCLDMHEITKIDETSVIYWRVKFPFPLSDRDYVFYRRTKPLPTGEMLVLSRSAPRDSHKAEVPGVIRVDDFRTRCALRPTPDGGVDYRMEYWEEQKGNIPQWAVRWAMDKAVDSMLEGMRKHMKLLST